MCLYNTIDCPLGLGAELNLAEEMAILFPQGRIPPPFVCYLHLPRSSKNFSSVDVGLFLVLTVLK
jgi:hypothetical protein